MDRKLSKINDNNLSIRENMDKTLKDETRIDKKAHRLANFGWFCIKHFAGGVIYNVEGFVEKNKDEINPEFLTIMKRSQNKVIQEIIIERGDNIDEEDLRER